MDFVALFHRLASERESFPSGREEAPIKGREERGKFKRPCDVFDGIDVAATSSSAPVPPFPWDECSNQPSRARPSMGAIPGCA